MKLFGLIILSSIFFSTSSQRPATKEDKNSIYFTKFRSVKCENFDNSSAILSFCFVKPISRTVTSLNFGLEIFKPLNSFFLRLIANFRYGNIYREIVDTKIVDFCGAMSGTEFNPFLKMSIEIISQSIPNLFHKCPYVGKNEFYNITIDNEISRKWSIFPNGQYK